MFSAGLALTDLDDALAALKAMGRDGNRALALAINEIAGEGVKALQAGAHSAFDRPTPFTLNAFRVQYAKASSPEAAIWVKDEKDGAGGQQAPEAWFEPQVYGGARRVKRSEYRLREIGALPSDMFIAPGPGARLDAYGNLSRGHMQQIMSGLGADNPMGSTMVATQSRRSLAKGHAKAFFVIKRGKKPIGIAERRGKSMSVVLLFVRQPSYSRRFDFHKIVRQVAENDALAEAAIDRAVLKVGRSG
ncbi:hypothetical protein ACFSB1_11175 [Halopseudomonas phragmitis]|uniref:Uncharacterized protein n=1 Tax=Halopseudomonas phragmitis TaxID=1931241 RepID=A0A1V0B9S6_9GAMM|nr:hypothetical protein [Halopseudomonas phragmitis]AQZ96641.1 hypothetical protein BVH74_18615 [Halopseudomonas phragmitis]